MLRPIKILWRPRREALGEADIRHFVERWLRRQLDDATVVCERARRGQVVVRVSSPVWAQEVLLWEYELGEVLRSEAGWHLRELTVTQW